MTEQTGPASTATVTPNPFPDHRDIYVLVAGLLLGVVLGPAVLGQIAPELHDRWFVGSAALRAELDEHITEREQTLRRLQESGVTEAAIPERLAAEAEQEALLRARLAEAEAAHARGLGGRLHALILAALALMVAEALVSPRVTDGGGRKRRRVDAAAKRAEGADRVGGVSGGDVSGGGGGAGEVVSPAVARLVMARYALMALWLAMVVAQPRIIETLPWLFMALLLLIALAAAFVPLGRRS
ncbi:MAG: hypothetical protein WD009_02065 [Phycisphaeraceae bacterium]